MTKDEKWRIWGAIDLFLDECLDLKNIEEMFILYDESRGKIWCPDGQHELIPDMCNLREHFFCKYCGVQQQALDKNLGDHHGNTSEE